MTVTTLPAARNAEERLAHIAELRQRVHRMQGTATSHSLPTLPALSGLIRLKTGASYAVDRPGLAMALMAGPSGAGSWSAVVGVPDFGLEAAAGFGVDLDRTVLVPEPGDAWLEVAAALIDVLQVVVVRPPQKVTQHQAARLSSRLRQRDALLISVGDWPHAESKVWIEESTWTGIGRGHGRLTGHRARVAVRLQTGQQRDAELWLPGADLQTRLAELESDQKSGQALPGPYVVRPATRAG
jgi:hypothetical protein